MKNVLIAAIAVGTAVACSEPTAEPLAADVEALVASVAEWNPTELLRDLPIDDATRQEITGRITALHTAGIELHRAYKAAHALSDEEREAKLAELQDRAERLHAQHEELWAGLSPDAAAALKDRIHEQMKAHHDEDASAFHERMRRLHHAGQNPHDPGH